MASRQATNGEAAVFWGMVLAVCDVPGVTVLADCPPEWAHLGPAYVPSMGSWPHLLIQARASGTPTIPPAGKFTVVTVEPASWQATDDISICDAGPVIAEARTALSGIAAQTPSATAAWAADARIELETAFANVPQQTRITAINEIEMQVAEIVQQRGLTSVGVDLVQEVIARRGRV